LSSILLNVKNIHTYYGSTHVLHGVSLQVKEGESVALMGRNSAGKTTTIRSIISLTPPKEGKIYFKGKDITCLPSHLCARMGISLCPQGRRIFPGLSVIQNLRVPVFSGNRDKNLQRVFKFFPELFEKNKQLAGTLSGGEQQMLAIARALIPNPKLLLLDEPTEGLSPLIVKRIHETLNEIRKMGTTILVASCNLIDIALAEKVYIIEKGKIVFQGTAEELNRSHDIQRKYLGVAL
jgi:branched-chain amino acid transport system ATP-binding protein